MAHMVFETPHPHPNGSPQTAVCFTSQVAWRHTSIPEVPFTPLFKGFFIYINVLSKLNCGLIAVSRARRFLKIVIAKRQFSSRYHNKSSRSRDCISVWKTIIGQSVYQLFWLSLRRVFNTKLSAFFAVFIWKVLDKCTVIKQPSWE